MSIALHKHKFDHTMKIMAHSRPELYEILPERDALKSSPAKVTPEMDKEFYKTLPAYAEVQKWLEEGAFGVRVLEVSHRRLEKRSDALKSSPVKVTPEMDKEFYKTLPSYADMQKWKKEDALGKSALEVIHRGLEKRRDALKSSPVKVTPEMDKEFYETFPSYADMQKKEDAFGKSALEAIRRGLEKRRDALKSSPVKVTPEMDKEFSETLPSYAEMQKWLKEGAFGVRVLEVSCRRLEKRFGVPDSHLPAAHGAKESKAECRQLSKYRVPDCCLPAARGSKESKAERKQQSKTKTFKLPTSSPLAVIASLRVTQLAELKGSVQYKPRGDQVIVGGKDREQPRPIFHG